MDGCSQLYRRGWQIGALSFHYTHFSAYFGDSRNLSNNNLNFVYLGDFATCSITILIVSTVYLANVVVVISTISKECAVINWMMCKERVCRDACSIYSGLRLCIWVMYLVSQLLAAALHWRLSINDIYICAISCLYLHIWLLELSFCNLCADSPKSYNCLTCVRLMQFIILGKNTLQSRPISALLLQKVHTSE